MSDPAISICNLTKIFRKKITVKAIDNLSLDIKIGEIIGILGENGAGKTTLIKTVLNLIKPTSGKIYVLGQDTQKGKNRLFKNIGAVLEGSRNIYWNLSAYQNMDYFGHLKGLSGKSLKDRIEYLISFFDLQDKRDVPARDMSRGMRQKLAICVALLADPDILLLDEPTLGLDARSSLLIREKIKELAKRDQKTVVLTTHQMDVAQELCDRVAIIKKGRIIVEDSTDNLLDIFTIKEFEFSIKRINNMGEIATLNFVTVEQREEGWRIKAHIKEDAQFYYIVRLLEEGEAKIKSVNENTDLESVFFYLTNKGEAKETDDESFSFKS